MNEYSSKTQAILAFALSALLIGSVIVGAFSMARIVYAQEAGDSAAAESSSSSESSGSSESTSSGDTSSSNSDTSESSDSSAQSSDNGSSDPATQEESSSDNSSTSDASSSTSTDTSSNSDSSTTDSSSDSSSTDSNSDSQTSESENSTNSTSDSTTTTTTSDNSTSNDNSAPVESTVTLEHSTIEINSPVEWVQTVTLSDNADIVAVEIPADAENLSVVTSNGQTVDDSTIAENSAAEASAVVTLDDVSEVLQEDAETMLLAIDEPATEYEIAFETPAPYTIENEQVTADLYQKNVTVTHDSAFHYSNVTSYSSVPEELVIRGIEFKLYWMVDDLKTDVTSDERFAVTLVDTDGNGIADQMQWVVPQLSEQQFVIEGIIVTITAERLDSNRNFVENVYDQTKNRDGVWTTEIPASDYIRVTFERVLNNTNDITVYARSNYPDSTIEVYEKDSNELIASFGTISADGMYKIYLINLVGSQDTFDLKVVGNPIEFDQIIDPSGGSIVLSTSSGPAGTSFTVSTTGGPFNGNALVTIKFDATTLGTKITNPGGNFQTPAGPFTVPATSVGPHTVSASDGINTRTATFTVTASNTAPIATPQSVTTPEDIPKTITLRGTDADSNSLTFSIVTNPTHGSLGSITQINATAASVLYTPTSNYNGADSLTFKVNDGTVDSTSPAMVSITITAVNDAPIATGGSFSTNEDTGKAFTLNATDIDSGSLTYSIVSGPSHGTVSPGTGASRTYTPNTDYNGPDSFTFKANDGSLDSNVANVTITVNAVNDAPVALAGSVTTDEDTLANLTLNATDVDGDSLTYIISQAPLHGILSGGTGSSRTYTPDADYNGPDSFKFKANDGSLNSTEATVTITVNAINDAPVAVNDSYSTGEDTQLTIMGFGVSSNDTDAEGDSLTAILVDDADSGVLALNSNGSFIYMPDSDFNGADSFTYKVNDGSDDSNVATVSISVNSVNDAPVAQDGSVTTNEDTSASLILNATDVEGDTLSYVIDVNPTHGNLTGIASNLTYTPDADYNGPDSFTFKVNDGSLDSNIANVTITINPVNDTPVAVDDNYSTAEDTPLLISKASLVANDTDVDGDTLSVSSFDASSSNSGTIVDNGNGTLTYTPASNFFGGDTFNYVVSDGNGGFDSGLVEIDVISVNDAPVAVDDAFATAEDTSLLIGKATLAGNDTDVDLDSLFVSATDALSTHGTITDNGNGTVTYTPDLNYNGPDSFNYTVSDGSLADNGTVYLTVTAVNDAPVATNDSATTDEDTTVLIDVLANDTDVENDPLTVAITIPAANGVASVNANGMITYTPNANYNGLDSFEYKVNDGALDSNNATVTITINPVNDAPVAANGSATTDEDMPKTITLNATDIDSSILSYSIVTGPTHGGLGTVTGNIVTYTPDLNYNGADSFTFRVNDGDLDSNIANVTIAINAVNDAPVAINDSATTDEDTQIVIDVMANDTDVETDTLIPTVTSGPSHGSAIVNLNGTITYTPDANYNGVDSFNYTDNDGSVDSNEATVNITVNPVNDAPIAINDTATTDEDTVLLVDVLANDTDLEDDTLSPILTAPAAHGIATVNSNGTITYTPDSNYFGQDSFQYKVNDGALDSNNATVSIIVSSVNDAPVAEDDNYSTDEDTLLSVSGIGVLTNDTDIENDSLSTVLVDDVDNGSLILNSNGSFTYMPDTDFNGVDSFSYNASDGTDESNVATVTVTVDPVNDAPVAQDGSATTDEDTPKMISLNATDVDSGVLSYSLVGGPIHGSLGTITGNNVTYTPDANYNGADWFTFKADDGALDSNIANVTITINAVNDAPIAQNDTYTTDEDTTLAVSALGGVLNNDTDIDSSSLSAVLVDTTTNGILTLYANGSFSFVPDLNFNGADSFTYKANDGSLDSDVATVNITINAVNDAPVTADDTYEAVEDTPLNVVAQGVLGNDTDVENDILSAILVDDVDNGSLTLNSNGSFTYIPNADFNGLESFTYKANDGNLDSNLATVIINVTAVNDAPVLGAVGDQAIDEEVELTFTATATDVDLPPDTLTFSLVSAPAGASINATTGIFSWTPTEAQGPGTFTFTVKVTDNGTPNLSDEEEIDVVVSETNHAPTLAAIANQSATEHVAFTSASPSASDSDIPANTLTFNASGLPNWATINTTTGVITGTPGETDGGTSSSVTVTVTDNGSPNLSANRTFTLSVIETNTAPTLAPISDQTANENVAFTSSTPSASDSDIPIQTLAFSATGLPAWASINPSNGVITGTPGEAFGGTTSSVTVKVTDNGSPNMNATRTFSLTVLETYTISGQKFEDLNGNKIKESGEPRLSGWTIFLDIDNDSIKDSDEPSTVTDSSGNYQFTTLASGTYYVREVLQSGWHQTLPEKYPTAPGKWTVVTSGGIDAINKDFGNIKVRTVTGFYQPIDMNNVVNVVKAGSAVPAKFDVFIGGTEQTSVSEITGGTLTAKKIDCSNILTLSTDDIEVTNTGATSLRYDSTGGQYIQNWKVPSGAGMCYSLTATMIDGTSITAYFKTK